MGDLLFVLLSGDPDNPVPRMESLFPPSVSRAPRTGRSRGHGWWKHLVWLSLIGFAPAGLAERPSADAPAVHLDAIFETNGMPRIGPKELATRYLQVPAARVSETAGSLGFRRIPREGGRKATLFGVEIDQGHFSFRQGTPFYINVTFLDRQRGVRMPRAEYDRLLGQVIEAVSRKTGVPPVKDVNPEPPGNTVSLWCYWPKTAYALNYSYRVESAGRRVPFQAEYISLRVQEPKAGE